MNLPGSGLSSGGQTLLLGLRGWGQDLHEAQVLIGCAGSDKPVGASTCTDSSSGSDLDAM